MNQQEDATRQASRPKLVGKTRSKTGCRTCRIRKVKCDEEKLRIGGQSEPHCRRCSAARIRCEWQAGPVPRKKPGKGNSRRIGQSAQCQGPLVTVSTNRTVSSAPVSTPLHPIPSSGSALQAANSLTLSPFDRQCLDYLQDSALVIILGKHWPWSTISYAYQRIAVKQPMLMSAILASTASEIHQSRLHDQERQPRICTVADSSDIDGRVHYGRALSGLREALKNNERSPEKVEAIFITLWLLIDYENRFGNGAAAINIHIRGIHSLLVDHVVPSLKNGDHHTQAITYEPETNTILPSEICPDGMEQALSVGDPTDVIRDDLRHTAVPLFLLWTLYFYTPGAVLRGPGAATIDDSLFRSFLRAQRGTGDLTLEDLYRISRQSPSRFWGDTYPVAAKLDDLENLPGLRLYHKSHILQFKITELFKDNPSGLGERETYIRIVDEITSISEEYDVVLSSTKSAHSCDIAGDGRRVMETMYWASIAFYGTIVYFYLCLKETHHSYIPRLMSLETAVSHVLELSLRLHRSRPRLMLRIPWQLFLAGIATPDRIYQDWVSIRLRELGCYGRNFARLSDRFDEIIRVGDPLTSVKYLGTLQGALA